MTVYVDDASIPAVVTDPATGTKYRARWFHLTADTPEELHEFGKKLGLNRAWFQDKTNGLWHYDITSSKRRVAVALGAEEVSFKDINIYKKPGRVCGGGCEKLLAGGQWHEAQDHEAQ